MAKTYRMTREERLSIAELILLRDVKTWLELSEDEVIRLLDAFAGYALIGHLMMEKGIKTE